MFRPGTHRTATTSALALLGVIFHASVRSVRKSHRNAAFGLAMNMIQALLFVLIFLALFELLGMRGAAVRGDFLLYVMTGIFMFMTHTKTMGAVAGAESSTSQMMMHAPMNTIVSISAAALSTLYIQTLSAGVILFVYHTLFTPITIDQPVGTMAMFLLSWASGIAVGMIFLAVRPWNPDLVGLLTTLYQRINMLASGKMFLANATPTFILAWFDWNPLFHTIDQTRGFVFLNYNPHYSNVMYPVILTVVCMLIGLMGEFYTRRHASASWSAGR